MQLTPESLSGYTVIKLEAPSHQQQSQPQTEQPQQQQQLQQFTIIDNSAATAAVPSAGSSPPKVKKKRKKKSVEPGQDGEQPSTSAVETDADGRKFVFNLP